jgi:hypothetical protein
MKSRAPSSYKQSVAWVPACRYVDLERVLPPWTRIWTLYSKETPVLPIVPVHFDNAFLEDKIHDWDQRGTILVYGSRVSNGEVWILIEEPENS